MKKNNLLKKFQVIIFGIIIGLLFAEVALRLIGYYPKILIPPYMYMNHPITGRTLRPGFLGEIDTPAGPVVYQINSQGIRASDDWILGNETNSNLIYAIGDSFTFGLGVNEAFAFPQVLDNSFGDSTSVVNLGVPGFGTNYTYERLLEYADRVGMPDIIIYTFVSNDPIDNIIGKKVVVNGVTMDPDVSNKELVSWIYHAYYFSRLAALAGDTYLAARPRLSTRTVEELEEARVDIANRQDFLATTAVLDQMIAWANQNGVKILVVNAEDSEYTAPLDAYLAEKSVPVIKGWQAIEQQNEKNQSALLHDGHWNPAGHQFIAKAIAAFIYEEGWIEK
jgi:lysophospholipase L1-like esterase